MSQKEAAAQDNDFRPRLFVPPLGRIGVWRFATVRPAERMSFVTLNRYPRQVIGVVFRLPSDSLPDGRTVHYALSIRWAKPARWWM